ncbi:hypothetical protein L917_14067 [Phytophthora nicotianae]|uniref:Crinkler effector protein N-terminal domain-containing protein n=1 Tax=Phytophthora nicotianae TaxID=4792 RepID=W2KN52_PHYNI|nr:hypothetical protein L917_14067 [Phytophthora nicotianae]
MKFICLILGAGSATFPVDMNAPNDIVGDLKKAIRLEAALDVAALKLDLFLAPDHGPSRLSKIFHGDLGGECVHVRVRLPQDVEAKMRDELGLTEVRKTRMINQIRHQIKIEQREAEDERREAEKAEEETERIGKIQPSSKRGKDGSTAFSAMEYGQLPKQFRTDEGSVKSGVFYDLMNEPNGLTDNMLDDLLKAIENKNCVYQDPTSNEATRIQFMSAIFESVVRMFKTDEQ